MLTNTLSVGQPKVGNQSNISVQSAEERRSESNGQEMDRCEIQCNVVFLNCVSVLVEYTVCTVYIFFYYILYISSYITH